MDLKAFASLMDRRAKELPSNLNELKKKVASQVLTDVVQDTPVDTGAAKSNWIVNLGEASNATRGAYVPGFKGSTGGDNASSAINAGQSVIHGATVGVDIHITNNLPYIVKLNQGYSPQAPSNFVQDAALRAAQTIKNAKVISR